MRSFRSAPPGVTLVNGFDRPYDNAVATARTCYSGKGIVTAEEVAGLHLEDPDKRERAEARRDALARDIFEAGHHTTLQHAHFQFALTNVSRQFLWSFLHAHPFYNSEQVSQRYVEVKTDSFLVPDLGGEAQAVYEGTVRRQMEAYKELTASLTPLAAAEYYARFPARSRAPEKWEKEIQKKAQEIARYVLPVATFSYLYHTVSAITLLRYWRIACQYDAPDEQRLVIGRMVEEMLRVDPNYAKLLEEPLPLEETLEAGAAAAVRTPGGGARRFREEFDASMDGAVSVLIDWKANNEAILAQSVREVLGLPSASISDDEAIDQVLDSRRNPYLGETLNLTSLSKLTRTLVHPNYTFRKRLSHTADSQDQRHRGTPGSRPALALAPPEEPDYVTPALVRQDDRVLARYREVMEGTWEGLRRLLALGVEPQTAVYLLPNATVIRFTESADLLSLRHKMAMRLCYLAQEEIWKASVEEAVAIRNINPRIGRYLLPPCTHRQMAGTTPFCPEGKRYCGVPVWTLDLSQYSRII
jgi:thymidylate synthase ThyX